MAKKSSIEKNNRRKRMVKRYAAKRKALKLVIRSVKASAPRRSGGAGRAAEVAAQFLAEPRAQPV